MKIRYKFFLVFVSITLFVVVINYLITRLSFQKIVYSQTEQSLDGSTYTNYLLLQNYLERFQSQSLDLKDLPFAGLKSKSKNYDFIYYLTPKLKLALKPVPFEPALPLSELVPQNSWSIRKIQDQYFLLAKVPHQNDGVLLLGRSLQPLYDKFYFVSRPQEEMDLIVLLQGQLLFASNASLGEQIRHTKLQANFNQWLSGVTSSGVFAFQLQDWRYTANYRTLNWQGHSLKILMARSEEFEKQIISDMILRLFVFSGFFILILLIFSYYVSRQIIQPFQRLFAAIAQRDQGSIQHLLLRQDEVGDLANQFWKMLDDLYAQQAQKEKVHSLIAHDLKTPLIAISRTLENIRDQDQISREQRISLINMMLRHCNHSLTLISNLLKVQKYELGKIKLFLAQEDMNQLVEESVEGLMPLAAERNTELVLRLNSDLPKLSMDRVELLRVLKNLLENAIKYTPPQGQIQISTGVEAGHTYVQIQDNGEGIPAALQESVFDFYHRGNRLMHDSAGIELSAGLGLYLCRQIIEAHGGEIILSSQRGQGTVFKITLPLAKRAEVM